MGGKNVFLWFCALVAAGGLIWLYNSRDTPKSPPLTQAEVKVRLAAAHQKIRALFPPGWYDLVNCSEFISFDGSRSLTLSRDYKARMQREQGRWSFDQAAQRYVINVGTVSDSYSLISPDGADVCILVSGEPIAANLTASWFAKIEHDRDDDDRGDPEPTGRFR